MNSIITKAAMGLGAAVLALGVTATPALAGSPSSTPASAFVAQSAGHWKYVGTLNSPRSCANLVNYYALLGVEARCDLSDGSVKFFIWVSD